MKLLKKPEEFPLIPVNPENKPGTDTPQPVIQPEHPRKIIPVEKPEENPQPEVEPGKRPGRKKSY